MNITQKLRGAMRRMAGVSLSAEKRRTVALPSILNSYGPRIDAMPKPTVANLRRFSETPVARKAINTIKDRIASRVGGAARNCNALSKEYSMTGCSI